MSWLKKIWEWFIVASITVGVVLLYLFLTRDEAQRRVAEIEVEIDVIDKDVFKKERERKKILEVADEQSFAGAEIDKQIKAIKERKFILEEKRNVMKKLFEKYGVK